MKHSRRDFIKISSGALGAMAVPSAEVKASAREGAAVVEMDTSGGSVSVSPAEGVAGEHGTWTVSYRVGPKGIKQHGGVRVQLPDSWHAGIRNSANRLQSSNPGGKNYISSKCSRTGVHLRTWVEDEPSGELVKSARRGLDGRLERYIYVIRVWVTKGELREDDTLSVIYGDTSGGSKGTRASIIRTRPGSQWVFG